MLAGCAVRGDANRPMKANKPARQRCTECRKWFHPAASARQTQRVCCERCRKKRDRVLAGARRGRELERYREEERERQRKCRQARRDRLGLGVEVGSAGVGVTECRAPP